jgi:hypothetical protein
MRSASDGDLAVFGKMPALSHTQDVAIRPTALPGPMMAEPTVSATSLSVATVALLGPLAGPWAIVVLCALAGAQWALSREKPGSTFDGALLVFKCLTTACVLSGSIALFISKQFPEFVPTELLGPVAFFLAAMGNRLNGLLDLALNLLRRGESKPNGDRS